MKQNVVEIPDGSGNHYRYGYEDGETRYLGPVGDSPPMSEEEFLMAVALTTGPLGGTTLDDTILVRLIEGDGREPTLHLLTKEYGIHNPDEIARVRNRLKVRQRLAGDIIKFTPGIGYEWELYNIDDKLIERGNSSSWQRAKKQLRDKREKLGMPEKNIDIDRLIRTFDRTIDRIPGGAGDHFGPTQFDPEQVEWGVMVELEHTNDPEIAMEIALDHLVEDRHYYTKLETIDPHLSRL